MPHKKIQRLNVDQELRLLETEYNRLSSEMKMIVQQFSGRFTIFATFVLTALGYALINPGADEIYIVIPFLVLVIGFVTIAQTFLLASESARVRHIERRVAHLNGGKLILGWEHMALKLVFPYFILLKGKTMSKRFLNPNIIAVITVLLTVCLIYFYCVIRAYFILPKPWSVIYLPSLIIMYLIVSYRSFSYFRFGKLLDETDFEDKP